MPSVLLCVSPLQAAREDEFLRKSLLESLPSLATRVQLIRQGKAATTVPDNDINMARSAVSPAVRGGEEGNAGFYFIVAL